MLEPPIVNQLSVSRPVHAGAYPAASSPALARHDDTSAHQPKLAWRGQSDSVAAVWMVAAVCCLSLACLMRVGEERQVFLLSWNNPVPEMCGMVQRWGIDCPGCGLTRCFIHMAHGQWRDALSINTVGVAVFLFVLLQILAGFAQVVLRYRNRWTETWGRCHDWIIAVLLVALLLQWTVRMSATILTW